MLPFQDAAPTPAGDWRHIVRFGRNVASYKSLCEHLQVEDRQSTSAQSQFLDACRSPRDR